MPPKVQPPRLFVITASAADEGVIFRRGPSSWYHVVRWDMAHDKFEPGAWFRGRIYPEKCDLSPDGRLLLCFVHQGRKSRTSYTHAWTAVSRTPWLTALGLWPQGTTYGGGGRFLNDRHVVLRAMNGSLHPNHPARGLTVDFGAAGTHTSTEEVAGADWSGRDRKGRLVFAAKGKIFRRSSGGKDRAVFDLTNMSPDPKPAPAWASRELVVQKGKRGI
jgi:hypothetical protein